MILVKYCINKTRDSKVALNKHKFLPLLMSEQMTEVFFLYVVRNKGIRLTITISTTKFFNGSNVGTFVPTLHNWHKGKEDEHIFLSRQYFLTTCCSFDHRFHIIFQDTLSAIKAFTRVQITADNSDKGCLRYLCQDKECKRIARE